MNAHALKKIAALEYGKDFIAGLDPTGTLTFRYASKYKSRHKAHRAIGTAGGMIGGYALGAALPAAAIGAAALALRKKPVISKELVTAAKGSLDALRPHRLIKHIRSPKKSGRALAAISAVPAALTAGALNASSSYMQYGEALKQKRKKT